jgi:hypothetical protein
MEPNYSFKLRDSGIDEPTTTAPGSAQPGASTPPPPPPRPISDPLMDAMSVPKVEYKSTDHTARSLDDLLNDIPEAESMRYKFEPEPAEAGSEDPEPEKKAASGSMVNLVVKNSDYLMSNVLSWMNDRPAANYKLDSEGRDLWHEAVSNYSTELSVEFSPKAQLMYSAALLWGGGIITGIINLSKKLFARFIGRKTAPEPSKHESEVQEAEIIHETPRPEKSAPEIRYCQLPGCHNELRKDQKSFCSIGHSAKDPNKKRGRKPGSHE